MKARFLICLLTMLTLLWLPEGDLSAAAQERSTLFREHFKDLDNWEEFFFPRIARHSSYTIERSEGAAVLRAESNVSASAIVHRTAFDVREFPLARWRWKVQNVYQAGDGRKKEGDDYPIRIYVMFEYRPERASAWERLQYGLAKKLYGRYPPHSSLSYVWASRKEDARILDSPFTDRAKMVLLQQGSSRAGSWQDEQVDMLADYRTAFGSDPPGLARLAVMNDSDNTGERSVSWLQYIEVFRGEAAP